MNFFCTKKHYDQWTSNRGVNEEDVFCLDAREAMIVAGMLFTMEE